MRSVRLYSSLVRTLTQTDHPLVHLININRGIRECLQEIDVDVIACLMQAVLEVVRVVDEELLVDVAVA